jgi:hypothetical protein
MSWAARMTKRKTPEPAGAVLAGGAGSLEVLGEGMDFDLSAGTVAA